MWPPSPTKIKIQTKMIKHLLGHSQIDCEVVLPPPLFTTKGLVPTIQRKGSLGKWVEGGPDT